jgi:eukaryotic-like serine/threonine-protein kinase
MLADSLANFTPEASTNSNYESWRVVALTLLEYRRGNFAAAANWLQRGSKYSGQMSSCIATDRVLAGMTLFQLGMTSEAKAELKRGRQMVERYFQRRGETGDNLSGHVQGWLHARILLREADANVSRFGL